MKAQYTVSVLASITTKIFSTNIFGCGASALQILKSDAPNTLKYQTLSIFGLEICLINGSLQTILKNFKSIILINY